MTTAVFSFLAISLFTLYAIRPTAQTIFYLRREIADKVILNQQMENKITTLIEAQAIYDTIRERLGIIEQALPHNPDGIIVAKQLKNLADVSGASVSAILIPSLPLIAQDATPGAKLAPPNTLEEFPVSIVLTGSYTAIRAFLDGILNMRRITSIDTISIKRTIILGAPGETLQLSVRLMSYYSKQ